MHGSLHECGLLIGMLMCMYVFSRVVSFVVRVRLQRAFTLFWISSRDDCSKSFAARPMLVMMQVQIVRVDPESPDEHPPFFIGSSVYHAGMCGFQWQATRSPGPEELGRFVSMHCHCGSL